VSIVPRVSGFTPGTSLAVELDFAFTRDIAGATLNEDFWNVNGTNPGNNPFTGTETVGIALDTENDTLFVSAGSELYMTATPMLLMTIETVGVIGTLSWGGRTALPGTPNAYLTSRIAQNGVNYDGLSGMGGGCACSFIAGDIDGNGSVGNSDLTLLLDSWGDSVPPTPAGWNGMAPTAPSVGNDELTLLLDAWGAVSTVAVPEPAALPLILTGICILGIRRRS
jgi:hypothetical protein